MDTKTSVGRSPIIPRDTTLQKVTINLVGATAYGPPSDISQRSDRTRWKPLVGAAQWELKGDTGIYFVQTRGAASSAKFRLLHSCKVKVLDETFAYLSECVDERSDKKSVLGFSFDSEAHMDSVMRKLENALRSISQTNEWDAIGQVQPGDSRFFDAFLPDRTWVEYDSNISMKRPKDYEPRPPRTCLAVCAGFICGDEVNALADRTASATGKMVKAAPILEHKYLLSDEDKGKGPNFCMARTIALKTIDYPPNWNGVDSKEHRKRGGKLVPWAHRIDQLIDRVFPEDTRYRMMRPSPPANAPSDIEDPLDWRDSDIEYHSFIAQESDAMMTTTYGHCFIWYRPVTHQPLMRNEKGNVLHSQVALVVLSKFCFTKTTRRRILRLPLRRLFGSNDDAKALAAVWHSTLAHPIDALPSTLRVGCRALHALSWNPKLTRVELSSETLAFRLGAWAKDDEKVLKMCSATQCDALIALVPSVATVPTDASLSTRRSKAADAVRLLRANKGGEMATRLRYSAMRLADIVMLETKVHNRQWAGQIKWIQIMKRYPALFPKGERSVLGVFLNNVLFNIPHRCSFKEHSWIVREISDGGGQLEAQVKRQCRYDKTTAMDDILSEYSRESWPRSSLSAFENYEQLFKFQMFPVLWWLATNRRCTFDSESSASELCTSKSMLPAFYISSKNGVQTFDDLEGAESCYDKIGSGASKVLMRDHFKSRLHKGKTRMETLKYHLSDGDDRSIMRKLVAAVYRHWPVTSQATALRQGSGIRGINPRPISGSTALASTDMDYVVTTICDFVRPRQLQCRSPMPRSDAPISRVCRSVMPVALISTFQALLLDSKVIVMSDYPWKLTDTLEVVLSMMFPFKCKNSLPSYEPLMPENECLNEYLESPYNFCYGVLKKRMVKDGLMESVTGKAYQQGDKLAIVDDEDARDILSSIVIVDLDIGDEEGCGFDLTSPAGRRRLNGTVIEKVKSFFGGKPITECQVVSEGYVGECLKVHRFQLLQSFADELSGFRPTAGVSDSCRFGWPSRRVAEKFCDMRTFDEAIRLPEVVAAISKSRRLKENLFFWEPLPRRYRMRLLRAMQLSYGMRIPSSYRSMIKDSVRQASMVVNSILMSAEEGEGTSDFAEEYVRSNTTMRRCPPVSDTQREDMVRWAFVEVLTSILKPFRLSLIGNEAAVDHTPSVSASSKKSVSVDYKRHIFEKLSEGKTPRLKMMLEIDKFIELNHIAPGPAESLDRAFLKSFTETQMFRQFVATKVKLKKRNVFDAWCALKNHKMMMQYKTWKARGVSEPFGRLSKLAKGDDGVHARSGFFGKFKGHKWRERLFHIDNGKGMDKSLKAAIEKMKYLNGMDRVEASDSEDATKDSVFGAYDGDDDMDDDDFDNESVDGTEDVSATQSVALRKLSKKNERMRKLKWQEKMKIIDKSFGSKPSGDVHLKWYDLDRDLRFRYLVEFVEAMRPLMMAGGTESLKERDNENGGLCNVIYQFVGFVYHHNAHLSSLLPLSDLNVRVRVTGVYNTKLNEHTCEQSASQKLLSKDDLQRHYMYVLTDSDGDTMTKRVAWYQVVAWKSQESSEYSLAIQHDKVREGDMIAICPQLTPPLVKECEISCSPEVLGKKKDTVLAAKLSDLYDDTNDDFHEYVWDIAHDEEHIGDLWLSDRELKKMEKIGLEAMHQHTRQLYMSTRIKKKNDGYISEFPDIRRDCIHSWTKETFVSPRKFNRSRPVYVVSLRRICEAARCLYPEAVVDMFELMAKNERRGDEHRFKIVPGQLAIGLPSEEYQRSLVEKAETPYYFKLDYNREGGRGHAPDKLLMCTAFTNTARREWMKAFKAVNYDEAKYVLQNAQYKASLDDDPATRALVEGGLTRSNALVNEGKKVYAAIKLYQKISRGKIDISSNVEQTVELLDSLLHPSALGGYPAQLAWLRRLKKAGYFTQIYTDLSEKEAESVSVMMEDLSASVEREAQRALLDFVMDVYDKWTVDLRSNGVKSVVAAIDKLHGGADGLARLLDTTKSALSEAGVKFSKRRGKK